MTPQLPDLVARGALFVVNHSGGKDSQAMAAVLRELVPAGQLVVVHASLGDVEWPGTLEHIEATAGGLPVHVTTAASDWWTMVERRGFWPSPRQRQCTSDLKRTPIERQVRRILRDRGQGGLVVNCMGMRAQESSARSKLATWKRSTRNSKAGRDWYDWLPIHHLTTDQVFAVIAAAGQAPHWAYAAGMSRLSCSFCIMASQADLRRAAQLRPQLYARYCATERRLDQTFTMPPARGARRWLPDVTGIAPAGA